MDYQVLVVHLLKWQQQGHAVCGLQHGTTKRVMGESVWTALGRFNVVALGVVIVAGNGGYHSTYAHSNTLVTAIGLLFWAAEIWHCM